MPSWEKKAKETAENGSNASNGSSILKPNISVEGFPTDRLLKPGVEDVSIEDIQESENIPVNGRAGSHAVRAIMHLSGIAFGDDGNAVFDGGMAVVYKVLEKKNG